MKTYIYIISRLYSHHYENDLDCEQCTNDKSFMRYCSYFSKMTIARSLCNQSCQDFVHISIINDKANKMLMEDYRSIVSDGGLKTTLIPKSEYLDFLNDAHKSNDSICISRMDIDDLVCFDAVENVRKAYVPGRLIIYGFKNGLRYDIKTGGCQAFAPDYKGLGHMSIMQSFLFDKTTPCYEPYVLQHVCPKTALINRHDKYADDSLIVYGDRKSIPSFVWMTHPHGYSSYRTFKSISGKEWPTELSHEEFKIYYGISPEELQSEFKKIMEMKDLP